MKLFKCVIVLLLTLFSYNADAFIGHAPRHPPKNPVRIMPQLNHRRPLCGACKKAIKRFGKNPACKVAKGFACHPKLRRDARGAWYKSIPKRLKRPAFHKKKP